MEYISAEEFRKQPKEVQDMFIEYFLENKSTNDLVQVELHPIAEIRLYSGKLQESKLQFEFEKEYEFKGKKIIGKYEITPLLSEGQLRKFIEDKTGCKLFIEYYNGSDILIRFMKANKEIKSYMFYNCNDLLRAYWKVACKIAKEGI